MSSGSKAPTLDINSVQIPGFSATQIRNAIIVGRRQQGNPVLKHIRNVRWVFGDVVPDYLLGAATCALYLSLRYHLLHPDYLYFRIRELQRSFRLRVVLCHVDVEDVTKPLHEVTKTCLLNDCTLFCAWSVEECARYLETLKVYENKPSDNIQERVDNDYLSRLTSALTSVRHVNKTDVLTLGSTFGSLSGIMGASMEELARCPGIGERKVKRLYDAFHEPFKRTSKQAKLDSILPPSLSLPPTTESQNTTALAPSEEGGGEQQARHGPNNDAGNSAINGAGNGAHGNGDPENVNARGDQLNGEHGTSSTSVREALDAAKSKRDSLKKPNDSKRKKGVKVVGVNGGVTCVDSVASEEAVLQSDKIQVEGFQTEGLDGEGCVGSERRGDGETHSESRDISDGKMENPICLD